LAQATDATKPRRAGVDRAQSALRPKSHLPSTLLKASSRAESKNKTNYKPYTLHRVEKKSTELPPYYSGQNNKAGAGAEDVELEPEIKPETETELETKPEPETELEIRPEPEAALEIRPEPETELETRPEPETELETRPEPEAALETRPEPETELETRPEPETELETETKEGLRLMVA